MSIPDEPRLPHINFLPPNLALMVLGKALAEAYRIPPEQPMPEELNHILGRLRELENENSDLS
jgi:hypothetical protein